MQTAHHSTFEIAGIVLTLRPELVVTLQPLAPSVDTDSALQQDDCECVIEDPVNAKFYRVGIPEYTFLSLLDGQTTVAGALAETAAVAGPNALTEPQAATLCQWLIENQLASTQQSRSAARLTESATKTERQRALQKINPITVKVPLLNPDRLLNTLTRLLGWLFSGPVFLVWLMTLLTGVYCVTSNWHKLRFGRVEIFSANNVMWLLGTWLVMKCLHELAHGIVCKRHGGSVNEAGVVLILFMPLPYVDVTSSWRFRRRWPRILTSAAGMYAELFLAAIAAIVWSQTGPGEVNHHALNVMITGSVMSLLFNANPLMRFDGYYILSDILRMPNLSVHGRQYTSWLTNRWLLGMDIPRPKFHLTNNPTSNGTAKSLFIRGYGLSAAAWRVLICVSLIIGAESLFFGAGVVLAVMAVCLWTVIPFVKFLRLSFGDRPGPKPSFAWITGLLLLMTAGGWLCWNVIPWFGLVEAPAVVDFARLTTVRTPVSGFVHQVHVRAGDTVAADDVLIELQNRAMVLESRELAVAILQSQQRERLFRRNEEISALQVEISNRQALEMRRQQLDAQIEKLTIRADTAGQIVATDLQALTGRYLSRGQDILKIGPSREIQALIAQRDLPLFEKRCGEEVKVRIYGSTLGEFQCRLQRINPRGRSTVPHPALASVAGGPLTVKRSPHAAHSETDDTHAGHQLDGWELLEPRFSAHVELPAEVDHQVLAGQKGTIYFRTQRGTVGSHLRDLTTRWWNTALKQSRSRM